MEADRNANTGKAHDPERGFVICEEETDKQGKSDRKYQRGQHRMTNCAVRAWQLRLRNP